MESVQIVALGFHRSRELRNRGPHTIYRQLSLRMTLIPCVPSGLSAKLLRQEEINRLQAPMDKNPESILAIWKPSQ